MGLKARPPRGRPRTAPRPPTPFGAWLDREIAEGRTVAELAEDLEVTVQTIYALADRTQRPSLPLAIKIETLTGGEIAVNSWLAD